MVDFLFRVLRSSRQLYTCSTGAAIMLNCSLCTCRVGDVPTFITSCWLCTSAYATCMAAVIERHFGLNLLCRVSAISNPGAVAPVDAPVALKTQR